MEMHVNQIIGSYLLGTYNLKGAGKEQKGLQYWPDWERRRWDYRNAVANFDFFGIL